MSDAPRPDAPYLIDVRKLVAVGAAVALAASIAGLFLWMTPKAAAREVRAACDGLHPTSDNPRLGHLPRLAPDFTVQGHDGKLHHLSDFKGKVVLLNFWASWCNVCKSEKPALAAMTEDLAQDDFVVVTLASDRSWDDVKKVLPKGSPFDVLLDPPSSDDTNIGAVAAAWGIKAVPESFVIDKRGNVRYYLVNKRDWDSPVAETCLQSMVDE